MPKKQPSQTLLLRGVVTTMANMIQTLYMSQNPDKAKTTTEKTVSVANGHTLKHWRWKQRKISWRKYWIYWGYTATDQAPKSRT